MYPRDRLWPLLIVLVLTLPLVGCKSDPDDNGGTPCTQVSDCDSLVMGSCQQAECRSNRCVVTDLADGASCDDGNDCSGPDTCSAGSCQAVMSCSCDSLAVADDGSGANGAVGLPNLVISEISPGNHIEFFNTTGADLDLQTTGYQLCSPFTYVGLITAGAGVTVPANGFAFISWPAQFTDNADGGEVILFRSGSFSTNTEMLDFVCWGTNPHQSRRTQAESVGKWSGPCISGSLAGGSVHRLVGVTGTDATSYDIASPPNPWICP